MTQTELAQKCISDLKAKRSPHTARLYGHGIQLFMDFCGGEITSQKFIEYPDHLILAGHPKKTASAYLSGARYFLNWLILRNEIEFENKDEKRYKDAVRDAFGRRERPLPKVPPKGAAALMIEAAKNQHIYSPIKERDLAIILTLATSGIRRGELQYLSVGDVDLENHKLFIERGKGSKDRYAFVSDECAVAIRNYWDVRGWNEPDDPAFARHDKHISKDHAYMTSQAIYDAVRRIANEAGLERFTPHQFRHDVATRLVMRAGVSAAKDILGHESIATTQGYTHITQEELQEIHKKVFG